jgi:hypothetical protein
MPRAKSRVVRSRVVSSDDDAPLAAQPPPLAVQTPPVIKPKKKKKQRYSKFADMMAKEGKEGHTASEGSESEDDGDESDDSCIVSDRSQVVSDAMRNIYTASLTSQGADLGFGVPIAHQRAVEEERGHGSIVQGIINNKKQKDARREARRVAKLTVPPVTNASPSQQKRKAARKDAPKAPSPKHLHATPAILLSPLKQLPGSPLLPPPVNSLVPHEQQFVSRMKLKSKPSVMQHSFPGPVHVIHHLSSHVSPPKSLLSHRGGLAASMASFEEACHAYRHVSPRVSPAKSLLSQHGGLAASFDAACNVIQRLSPHVSPNKSLFSQPGGPADSPDSPVSRFEAWKHTVLHRPGIYGCSVSTQTNFDHEPEGRLHSAVQTSPRHAAEPLTLQDLRSELRAFLVGIGF